MGGRGKKRERFVSSSSRKEKKKDPVGKTLAVRKKNISEKGERIFPPEKEKEGRHS